MFMYHIHHEYYISGRMSSSQCYIPDSSSLGLWAASSLSAAPRCFPAKVACYPNPRGVHGLSADMRRITGKAKDETLIELQSTTDSQATGKLIHVYTLTCLGFTDGKLLLRVAFMSPWRQHIYEPLSLLPWEWSLNYSIIICNIIMSKPHFKDFNHTGPAYTDN